MQKKLIFGALLVLLIGKAGAQQLQTSSLYEFQGAINNPSMAGLGKSNVIGLSYRNQWTGIDGHPATATVFGSFKIPQHEMGISAYAYSDKTGPSSRTGVDIAFARHFTFRNGGVWSMGIEGRFIQFAINKDKLVSILGADPALGSGNSSVKFDAGFGTSYTTENFQIGASVSQLVQSRLNFYTGDLNRTTEARLYRHFYGHASYTWHLDAATSLVPQVMVVHLPNAPTEIQAMMRVEHDNLFWWGFGMRRKQGLIMTAGLHVDKKLTIGYSFDMYKTPLSSFDAGSNGNEVMLCYKF
jgi:hypothetical protein